jgi:glycosyltransferase involved in cell wall biosynthesis
MSNPLVSVIIATCNWKEKRFSQTLDSVVNQSYKNIEIIMVNDASTNNVEEFILWYCKKYQNIIYLKNEKNSERSYSRNRWIFESKWKYIAFIDDDDIWEDREKLQRQINFFENNKNSVLCGTSIIEIDENNNKKQTNIMRTWNKKIKNTFLQSNQFALSSVMIKKNVLYSSWLFNVEYNKAEDYDLWLRIWRYWDVDNIKDSFILYRSWEANTSNSNKKQLKYQAFKFMWKHRNYYPNFFKALILRIWDFVLWDNCTHRILNILKNN